jgi:type II secretory pathway component PulC
MDQGQIAEQSLSRRGGMRISGLTSLFSPGIVFLVAAFVLLLATKSTATHRNDAGFERFQAIAEKNMFARPPAPDAEAVVRESLAPADTPEIKLIGIVRMRNPLSSIAIIEDGDRHRLCRVGDHIGTLVLRSIRDQDIIFETPQGPLRTEIALGATRPDSSPLKLPDPAGLGRPRARSVPPSCRRLPIRAIDVQQLAETGLAPYTEDGHVKGLELTRDVVGLRKGDRVTHVDGQALNAGRPRQKLWQIVRKHTISRMPIPGIHVVVERNRSTVEFLVSLIG